MRGIRCWACCWALCYWFIPADAGNTPPTGTCMWRRAVHPRGCGEYAFYAMVNLRVAGSSPRMRGILLRLFKQFRQRRFIPADAGNTWASLLTPLHTSVHPRGCGEYANPVPQGGAADRFIPADAGNTPPTGCWSGFAAVHPRGCGEYVLPGNRRGAICGSSPRMRGIRNRILAPQRIFRFIPADAGNTRPASCPPIPFAVHPRGCGEY